MEILKSIGSLTFFLVFMGMVLAIGISIFTSMSPMLPAETVSVDNESLSTGNGTSYTLLNLGMGIVSINVWNYDRTVEYTKDVNYTLDTSAGTVTFIGT